MFYLHVLSAGLLGCQRFRFLFNRCTLRADGFKAVVCECSSGWSGVRCNVEANASTPTPTGSRSITRSPTSSPRLPSATTTSTKPPVSSWYPFHLYELGNSCPYSYLGLPFFFFGASLAQVGRAHDSSSSESLRIVDSSDVITLFGPCLWKGTSTAYQCAVFLDDKVSDGRCHPVSCGDRHLRSQLY